MDYIDDPLYTDGQDPWESVSADASDSDSGSDGAWYNDPSVILYAAHHSGEEADIC